MSAFTSICPLSIALTYLQLLRAEKIPLFQFLLLLLQSPCYIVQCLRSEEHTSEHQSHHDLVCRLLLEKKNKPVTCKLRTILSPKVCRPISRVPSHQDGSPVVLFR